MKVKKEFTIKIGVIGSHCGGDFWVTTFFGGRVEENPPKKFNLFSQYLQSTDIKETSRNLVVVDIKKSVGSI